MNCCRADLPTGVEDLEELPTGVVLEQDFLRIFLILLLGTKGTL